MTSSIGSPFYRRKRFRDPVPFLRFWDEIRKLFASARAESRTCSAGIGRRRLSWAGRVNRSTVKKGANEFGQDSGRFLGGGLEGAAGRGRDR
jgi:hypothetical protein